MAATFIPIDTSKRLGSELRQVNDTLRLLAERLRRLKEVMDTQVDGIDYSLLETHVGIATGQGQTVYNLTAGAWARLNHTDMRQFLDRLG